MRSYQIVEWGQPIELREQPTPTPQGTEVLLRVTAAGICHSDLHINDGYFDLGDGRRAELAKLGATLPLTLGHEIVGVVEALGPDAEGRRGSATRAGRLPLDRLPALRDLRARARAVVPDAQVPRRPRAGRLQRPRDRAAPVLPGALRRRADAARLHLRLRRAHRLQRDPEGRAAARGRPPGADRRRRGRPQRRPHRARGGAGQADRRRRRPREARGRAPGRRLRDDRQRRAGRRQEGPRADQGRGQGRDRLRRRAGRPRASAWTCCARAARWSWSASTAARSRCRCRSCRSARSRCAAPTSARSTRCTRSWRSAAPARCRRSRSTCARSTPPRRRSPTCAPAACAAG